MRLMGAAQTMVTTVKVDDADPRCTRARRPTSGGRRVRNNRHSLPRHEGYPHENHRDLIKFAAKIRFVT